VTPSRLRPLAFAVVVWFVGCSRGEPVAPAAPEPGPLVPVLNAVEPPPTPPPPVVVVPPPVPFRLPADAGGRAVAAVTAPTPPAPAPLPTVKAPRPRVSDLDRGELPPTPIKPVVRALPVPPGKPALPTPPAERLPADFGLGSIQNTGDLKLPETVSLRPPTPAPPLTAADVPRQARQRPDKPPADDTIDDLIAAQIVFTPLSRPVVRELLMLFRLPDPFELAEQLRRLPTPPVAPADADARPVIVK
jgi:hypothetical protein